MTRRRSTKVFWVVVPILFALLATGWLLRAAASTHHATSSGAPGLINYQGYLLDDAGEPVSSTVTFNFGLYPDASGGVSVWEETQTGVPVVDGSFSVMLGSVNPLSATDFDDVTRYLEVSVDTGVGPVAMPRQRLASVPYALQAEDAKHATTADHAVTADTALTATRALTATNALAASSVPWPGITGRPSGLDDGDDDTTYTAGNGLMLVGTQFNVRGGAYANVVVVARSGGDHTSVQAAIDSITDAGPDNPYLVWIGPGVYSGTLTMKPHVHVQGAGWTPLSSPAPSRTAPFRRPWRHWCWPTARPCVT